MVVRSIDKNCLVYSASNYDHISPLLTRRTCTGWRYWSRSSSS